MARTTALVRIAVLRGIRASGSFSGVILLAVAMCIIEGVCEIQGREVQRGDALHTG